MCTLVSPTSQRAPICQSGRCWVSRGRGAGRYGLPVEPGSIRHGCEQVGKDLAGDIELEAAHDLGFGLALGGAAGDVVPGLLVTAHADQGDAPQGTVGL